MRLDELPRSDNIEDRRGAGNSTGGFGIPGGRGGLGIGTIIVLGLIGWSLGIDPRLLIGGAEMVSGGGSSYQQQDRTASGRTGAPSDQVGQLVSGVLGSTEVYGSRSSRSPTAAMKPPTLVMFSGAIRSACGFANAAMGPFYCPNDQKVYLDTSFFQDLETTIPRVQRRQQDVPILAGLRDRT